MQRLEANEVQLHKVFCSDYDFSIPDYQRPYAWETEQASQLLADLVEALDRGSDEPYFLGSIVLVKKKEVATAEVIDGQQRLTTLTILLSVLRDLTDDAELEAELNEMVMEPGKKVLGLQPKPRLALRQRDAEFFRAYVQARGSVAKLLALDAASLITDSQRAVRANAQVLHKELAGWTEDRLLALVQMLGERTFLVVVSTPDLDSAHRIFSVMNARGLDLSPADIFKSYVIGALDGEASHICATKWEDAEEALGREDFADLFLHIRMIYARVRAKEELLKEFPVQVLNRFLPDRAQEFVNEVVVPYSDAYAQIRDGGYTAPHGADAVNAWFRRLSQLDNNDWRPAALWALREHPHDPVWLDAFFRALERLAASLFIRRVYTTPRVQRYAELLNELAAGEGLEAAALSLSAQERADTLSQLGGDLYLVKRIRKYVLLRLDEVLAGSPGVTYEHPLITVEHVLPQNPNPDSVWQKDFTEEQRVQWTHRLANLVLMNRAKNSLAQNYDFSVKKVRYFTGRSGVAAFALTTQVLGHETWTPEVLKIRQESLLGALRREWAL